SADELVSPDNTGLHGYYRALAHLPGAAVVVPVAGVATVALDHPRQEIQLEVPTNAEFGDTVERPKITAGRMPHTGRASEVFAGTAAARAYHLRPGSRLRVLA